MIYGKNNSSNDNIKEAKKILADKLAGVDANKVSQDDLKQMIMSEINNNKNLNIDEAIKEKINNGDIEGLKAEAIKYLSKNKLPGGAGDKLMNMLQNNDTDELANQLMGMLLGNLNQQKKNEINENDPIESTEKEDSNPLKFDFSDQRLMKMLINQMFAVNQEDEKVVLLNAIRPFMSDLRKQRIDDCINIIAIIGFMQKKVGKAGE